MLLNGAAPKDDIFLCLDSDLADGPLMAALQAEFRNVQTARLSVSHSVEWKLRRWMLSDAFMAAATGENPGSGGGGGKRRPTKEDLSWAIEDLPCVALVLRTDTVVPLLPDGGLTAYLSHVATAVHPTKRLWVICEGVGQYFASKENAEFLRRCQQANGDVQNVRRSKAAAVATTASLDDWESAVAEARVALGGGLACIYGSRNPAATAQFLTDLSVYLAEAPYKRSNSTFPRSARTPEEAWPAMLRQIPKVTEEVARAIVGAYPTMASLYRAYEDDTTTLRQRRDLLQHLRVDPGPGGASRTGRNLGPALSQRVYATLMGEDPDAVL